MQIEKWKFFFFSSFFPDNKQLLLSQSCHNPISFALLILWKCRNSVFVLFLSKYLWNFKFDKTTHVFLSCIQMDIINSDWFLCKLSDLYWNQFWNKIYNSLSNIWNFKRFKYPNYSRLSIHLDNIPFINKQVPIFFEKKVLVHSLSFAFIEI